MTSPRRPPHPARLLFLGPLPDPIHGQSLACQVLLDELERRGSEIAVVDLSTSNLKQGLDSLSRLLEVARILASVWRLRRQGDCVYFTISQSRLGNLRDLLIYAICFRRLGRMVMHLHGGAGLRKLLRRGARLTRAANRFFLSRLAGVVVVGERHADIFDGLMAPERIHVVPNFAEDEIFVSESEVVEKFRRSAPLRLLFLSNLVPGKGHLELLDAYASLDAGLRAAVEIDFAGGFGSRAERDAFVARLDDLPGARYRGTVRGAEKRRLFASAHVFCLPTYYAYEGQPISLLEAYASGCAVVTTDHSGIFDVFTPGLNGIEVEKRSVESLAAALAALAKDPGPLAEMALGNLREATTKYRTDRFTEELAGLLARVAVG